jgi:Fe-coproporphyrin III synthase
MAGHDSNRCGEIEMDSPGLKPGREEGLFRRAESTALPREKHRVTQLPVLVLHVHSSCNCRCVMCDIWKTSEVRELKPADLEPHLSSIRWLGVRWIVFSGGEPLLNRGFPELCAMLKRERIRLTLLTTGLLLKKDAREVVDSFDDVIVSLDGPKEVHDSIRQVRGGFDSIDAGVRAIRDIRPRYRITARSTVQKANFRHLRETTEAAKLLGLDGISFLPVDLTSQAFNRPLVWPIERQNEIGLCASDLTELEAGIARLIRENAGDIQSGFVAESPDKLWRIVKHFRAHLELEEAEAPPCNAPWTSAVVEIDGSVRPCFFHPTIGSIRDESLQEVINSERALQFRSTLDIRTNPTCKRCVCSLNYRI